MSDIHPRLGKTVKITDDESFYDGQTGTVVEVSILDDEVLYIVETKDPHVEVKMMVRIGCLESEIEFQD